MPCVRNVASSRAGEAGEITGDWPDDGFIDLLDATTVEASPVAERILAILQERGWRGWTLIERVPEERLTPGAG